MEKEIWVPIPKFENYYLISSYGNVMSLRQKKILKLSKYNTGYYFVNLIDDNKKYSTSLHRLMAHCFLGFNIYLKNRTIVVDHIDNNKSNNNISNLQIVSNRHNSIKDKIPKSNHSCIYTNNNKHLIRCRYKGIKYSFGTYANIEEAIRVRDYLFTIIENNLTISELKELIEIYKIKSK